VLEHSLRLLHPYMPYVTETIWQNLPGIANSVSGRALIISRWPQDSGLADREADDAFGRLQEIVRSIRNLRSEYNVEPGRRIPTMFSAGEHQALIQRELPLLASLARLASDQVSIAAELPAPDKAVTVATSGITVYVPLAGLVDFEAERNRLQKEIDNLTKQIERSENLLANQGFVAKAPLEVIERERTKIAELGTRRQQLTERLADL
jgi:valyl-tRNA synthetase